MTVEGCRADLPWAGVDRQVVTRSRTCAPPSARILVAHIYARAGQDRPDRALRTLHRVRTGRGGPSARFSAESNGSGRVPPSLLARASGAIYHGKPTAEVRLVINGGPSKLAEPRGKSLRAPVLRAEGLVRTWALPRVPQGGMVSLRSGSRRRRHLANSGSNSPRTTQTTRPNRVRRVRFLLDGVS